MQLRLNLVCTLTADSCGAEGDAYEFMTSAFTTYEEEISDSREQLAAVKLAATTLHHTKNFSVRWPSSCLAHDHDTDTPHQQQTGQILPAQLIRPAQPWSPPQRAQSPHLLMLLGPCCCPDPGGKLRYTGN